MSALSEAVAELYSADPETFTARRKELAAEARRQGDAAAAKSVAALGKPTKSAWLVNKLVRADPTVPARLAELGDQLRAGEAALDGATIRRLSAARRELIESLVKQALGPDAQRQATLREEVTGTLNAALADPEVARQVAAGTVVKAATWAGFGPGIGTGLAAIQSSASAAPPRALSALSALSARDVGAGAGTGAGAGAGGAETAGVGRGGRATSALADPGERRRLAIAEASETADQAARDLELATTARGERQHDVRLAEQQLHQDQDRLAQAERGAAEAQQRLAEAQRALADSERGQAGAEQHLAGTRKSLAQARKHLADADATVRQATAAQRRASRALERLTEPPAGEADHDSAG